MLAGDRSTFLVYSALIQGLTEYLLYQHGTPHITSHQRSLVTVKSKPHYSEVKMLVTQPPDLPIYPPARHLEAAGFREF